MHKYSHKKHQNEIKKKKRKEKLSAPTTKTIENLLLADVKSMKIRYICYFYNFNRYCR